MSIVMKMENKYQEALDYIVENSCNKRVACNECDIQNICNSLAKSKVDTLQELVDKTKPKKPIISYPMGDCYYTCSCCGHLLIEKRIVISLSGKRLIKDLSYCNKCGGEVDWSDIDDC